MLQIFEFNMVEGWQLEFGISLLCRFCQSIEDSVVTFKNFTKVQAKLSH